MEEIVYAVMISCKVYGVFRDKESADKYLQELREKVGCAKVMKGLCAKEILCL